MFYCLLRSNAHGRLALKATDFKLIETMLHKSGEGFPLIDAHMSRLRASASGLGFIFDESAVRDSLDSATAESFGAGPAAKVRLLLSSDGKYEISAEPAAQEPPAPPRFVSFSPDAVSSAEPFLRHKTTRREFYDTRLAVARARGLYDILFLNERGEATEGAWNNIVAEVDGALLTPPVSCGLLPGVFRQSLLERGAVAERILSSQDLQKASALYCCNAVRGLVEVSFIDGFPDSL
jgi:branched-subunit amino acid aminotransferase/4-amino-4-deoxychorismate lyase